MSIFLTPVSGLHNKPLAGTGQSSKPKSGDYITEMDRARSNVKNDPQTYSRMIWESYNILHGL